MLNLINIIYWKLFGIVFFFAFIDSANATQSVYSCPLEAFNTGVNLQSRSLFGPRLGYPGGIIDICPTSSFIHYYVCCENNPFECCWQIEIWAIVFFSVILVIITATAIFLIVTRFFSNKD